MVGGRRRGSPVRAVAASPAERPLVRSAGGTASLSWGRPRTLRSAGTRCRGRCAAASAAPAAGACVVLPRIRRRAAHHARADGAQPELLKLEVAGVDGDVLLGAFVIGARPVTFTFPKVTTTATACFKSKASGRALGWRVIAGYGDAVGGAPVGRGSSFLGSRRFSPRCSSTSRRGRDLMAELRSTRRSEPSSSTRWFVSRARIRSRRTCVPAARA